MAAKKTTALRKQQQIDDSKTHVYLWNMVGIALVVSFLVRQQFFTKDTLKNQNHFYAEAKYRKRRRIREKLLVLDTNENLAKVRDRRR